MDGGMDELIMPSGMKGKGPNLMKNVVVWKCQECGVDCLTAKPEVRCICGHRFKEHKGWEGDLKSKIPFPCGNAKCSCKAFFYHVASGSWSVRCRCKHKHIEHEPNPPYKCNKPKCQCNAFDSPFVCNCDHGWASHQTVYTQKEFVSMLEHIDVQSMRDVRRGEEAREEDMKKLAATTNNLQIGDGEASSSKATSAPAAAPQPRLPRSGSVDDKPVAAAKSVAKPPATKAPAPAPAPTAAPASSGGSSANTGAGSRTATGSTSSTDGLTPQEMMKRDLELLKAKRAAKRGPITGP